MKGRINEEKENWNAGAVGDDDDDGIAAPLVPCGYANQFFKKKKLYNFFIYKFHIYVNTPI